MLKNRSIAVVAVESPASSSGVPVEPPFSCRRPAGEGREGSGRDGKKGMGRKEWEERNGEVAMQSGGEGGA